MYMQITSCWPLVTGGKQRRGLQGEIRHALWEYSLTLNASRCRFGAGRMEMDDMLIVCLIEAIVGSAR